MKLTSWKSLKYIKFATSTPGLCAFLTYGQQRRKFFRRRPHVKKARSAGIEVEKLGVNIANG